MSSVSAPRRLPVGGLAPFADRFGRWASRRAGEIPHARTAEERSGRLLSGLLLALIFYAALDHGAVTTAAGARVEVMTCLLAAIGAVGLIWTRRLVVASSRAGWIGLALLGLFVLWSGISLAWSAAPDSTWQEFNRLLGYLLILSLAFLLGASDASASARFSGGFLLISGVVTLYALGQKLVPWLHIGSIFDLNQAGPIPRLQEPLGYWNALALFIAFGIPIAIFRVLDRDRPRSARVVSLAAAQLMVVTLGFTLSRGGLLALVIALAAAALIARAGLRALMWSAIACVAALPPLVIGLSLHALNASNVPLARRAGAGAVLAAVLILCLLALMIGGRRLAEVESRTQLSEATLDAIRRGLRGLALGLVLALVVGVALSSRGFGGEISHAWHTFTASPTGNVYNPQHLLSEDSAHRWVWWKEAAGAFSDRPLAGWGAGAFPVVHLLYRRDLLSVTQPHSLPLQFLAETGVIGAMLGFGALVLLLVAATRAVRAASTERERFLRAGLLAAALAFAIQSLYDWDWDIPALALPALAFLGLLAGTAGRQAREERAASAAHDNGAPLPTRRPNHMLPAPAPRLGARAGAIAACALALCVVGLSAGLPSLAAGNASAAIVAADSGASGLRTAQAEAALAARLDPLSDAGLRIEATIAQRRGQLALARVDLREAIHRQPTDFQAWEQLAGVELLLGDFGAAVQAGERALSLDPRGLVAGASAFEISQFASLLATPPRYSATAIPLPATAGALATGTAAAPDRALTLPPVPLRPIVPGVNGTSASTTPRVLAPDSSSSAVPAPAPTPAPAPQPSAPKAKHRPRPSAGGTGSGGTSTTHTYPAPGGSTTTTPAPTPTTTTTTGGSPTVTVTTTSPPPPP